MIIIVVGVVVTELIIIGITIAVSSTAAIVATIIIVIGGIVRITIPAEISSSRIIIGASSVVTIVTTSHSISATPAIRCCVSFDIAQLTG